MLQDPFIVFLLPSYVKAQAQALTSLSSPPPQVVSKGYDPRVRSYIDDETLRNV
jgi:hypothetical protein